MNKLKPNVIFLVIDSFRSDRFFGDTKSSITPNLDKLRNSGSYFSQNISSADGTILSLNTIFTGFFPCTTGTREKKINLEIHNYFSILKKSGYSIYSIHPKLTSFSSLSNLSDKTYSFKSEPPAESLFDGVGEKINELLSISKKEPWFCYIHFFDLHWPLVVPKKFDNIKFGKDSYDRIVSSIDYYIGKFLEKIELDNTLLIITADHGAPIPFDGHDEVFFEPDFNLGLTMGKKFMPKITHKFGRKFILKIKNQIKDKRVKKANKNLTNYQIRSRLPGFVPSLFDEVLKTPLLFTGYNIKSNLINQQVRSIDIFPTILDILQFPTQNNVEGKSLLPLMNEETQEENPCFIHTIPLENISEKDLMGIRTPFYKYFRHARNQNSNVHLYDLINDKEENNNIAKNNNEIVSEMEKLISNFFQGKVSKTNISKHEEQEIQDELRKLGYI